MPDFFSKSFITEPTGTNEPKLRIVTEQAENGKPGVYLSIYDEDRGNDVYAWLSTDDAKRLAENVEAASKASQKDYRVRADLAAANEKFPVGTKVRSVNLGTTATVISATRYDKSPVEDRSGSAFLSAFGSVFVAVEFDDDKRIDGYRPEGLRVVDEAAERRTHLELLNAKYPVGAFVTLSNRPGRTYEVVDASLRTPVVSKVTQKVGSAYFTETSAFGQIERKGPFVALKTNTGSIIAGTPERMSKANNKLAAITKEFPVGTKVWKMGSRNEPMFGVVADATKVYRTGSKRWETFGSAVRDDYDIYIAVDWEPKGSFGRSTGTATVGSLKRVPV